MGTAIRFLQIAGSDLQSPGSPWGLQEAICSPMRVPWGLQEAICGPWAWAWAWKAHRRKEELNLDLILIFFDWPSTDCLLIN